MALFESKLPYLPALCALAAWAALAASCDRNDVPLGAHPDAGPVGTGGAADGGGSDKGGDVGTFDARPDAPTTDAQGATSCTESECGPEPPASCLPDTVLWCSRGILECSWNCSPRPATCDLYNPSSCTRDPRCEMVGNLCQARTACKSASDCKLFVNDCGGCQCTSLGKDEKDPMCPMGIERVICEDPCFNKAATCVSGKCAVGP